MIGDPQLYSRRGREAPPVRATMPVGRLALGIGGVSFLIFLSESVFARPNSMWALALLLWAILSTLLMFQLVRPAANRIWDWVDAHAAEIVWGMVAAAAAAWIIVSVLQARWFALGSHAEDMAYYSQILWNTLHGNFLAGNVQQERLYNPPVSNELALHVSPVFALLLPLYAIAPHFLTLLIIRDVMLALAAWPLFLLARERIGASAGVAAVLLYLMNPAVIAQGMEAFYPLQLAPVFFFLALRAFVREDLGRFCLWMMIAMSMREDVAIAVAGFGLWALVIRRPFRWPAIGLGLPMVWWAVATLLVQPAFGNWGNNVVQIEFAGGNHAALGIFQVFLGSPVWLLDTLKEGGGLHYLYRELRSVGFLALLGWDGLLALPGLAANVLIGRMLYQALDSASRLSLMPSCSLIGASILMAGRLAMKADGVRNRRALAVLLLMGLPSVSLLDGVKDAIQGRLSSYTVANDDAALREGIQRIPGSASVAAPNYALPALASRERLYYVQYLHMYAQAQPEYLLVDQDVERITANPKLRTRYLALLEDLAKSTQHELVWKRGAYRLYRNREPAAATGTRSTSSP